MLLPKDIRAPAEPGDMRFDSFSLGNTTRTIASLQDGLLESLDERVGMLLELNATKKALSSGNVTEPSKVEGALRDTHERISDRIERTNPLVRIALDEYWKVRDAYTAHPGTESMRRMLELETVTDVAFLKNLDSNVVELIQRNQATARLASDPGALANVIRTEAGLKPGSMKDSVVTPFGIAVWFPESEVIAARCASGRKEPGFTLHSAPVYVIGADSRAEFDTRLEHERIHGETHGTDIYGRKLLDATFARLPDEWLKAKLGEAERELQGPSGGKLRAEILSISPSLVLNMLHHEIVASLPALQRTLPATGNALPSEQGAKLRAAFSEFRAPFETAGSAIEGAVHVLEGCGRRWSDRELGSHLIDLSERTRSAFSVMAISMKDAMRTASLLGGDQPERVMAAFFILKPDQYRHAAGYLEHLKRKT